MIELLRTNDLILISRVEAVLAAGHISALIVDAHMSALEGSLPFLPRRILVAADFIERARCLLREAGLGHELSDE
ncbi:MAG TPA: DUF2007 domain-containing protein [Methylocella sp.]|nr:DUF2007 domain-containing protein [Methylocella sp.]